MKVLRLAACLLVAFSSCNTEETLIKSNGGNDDTKQINNGILTEKITSQFIESKVAEFAKPNSTVLNFQVEDPNGFRILAVKFYDRATDIATYVTMTRSGKYWKLDKKMEGNSWYDWRYVYKDTKTNISDNAYVLCSTYNTFNSTGLSSIRWPFGADGSSFTNRLKWIGSHEKGGCGSDWKKDGHKYLNCEVDDTYAEDWNKDCSKIYSDDGAEVRSPLDGQVVGVNGIGYGNSVDIKQIDSNGDVYIWRIGHLKYESTLKVNVWVKAGITKIGYIGMTGKATAPHAHMVLYKQLKCKQPMQFLMNAN